MTIQLARLESYKYPQQPRYFYPVALIEEKPERLILYQAAGSPVWSYRTKDTLRMDSHALNIIYPDRDYNVVLFWKANWDFNDYYVNVALPGVWDGELCSYIDLDLDILYLTQDSVRVQQGLREAGAYVLDREEFEQHKIEHSYPDELVERIEKGLQTALADIEQHASPFDDALLHWRPSPEMVSTLVNLPNDAAQWHLQ